MRKRKTQIKEEKLEFIKGKVAEILKIVPLELKSVIDMILSDIRKEDYNLASARCLSIMNKLNQVPTIKKLLCEILPNMEKEIKLLKGN